MTEDSDKSGYVWDDVKEALQNITKRLPKQISSPSLSLDGLVTAKESLTLSLPSPQRLKDGVKTLRKEMRKMRSKSCERVMQRISRSSPQPEETFQQGVTLRRSRRCGKTRAKPSSSGYSCYARALVNHTPSPYDEEWLPLTIGDLIGVTSQNSSGTWEGECEGRLGKFKFIHVELVDPTPSKKPSVADEDTDTVLTISDLLARLKLDHLLSKLDLNGFDCLEKLETITRADMEFIGIIDNEEQDKLLQAGWLLEKKEPFRTINHHIDIRKTNPSMAERKINRGSESSFSSSEYSGLSSEENIIDPIKEIRENNILEGVAEKTEYSPVKKSISVLIPSKDTLNDF